MTSCKHKIEFPTNVQSQGNVIFHFVCLSVASYSFCLWLCPSRSFIIVLIEIPKVA